MNLKPAKQSHQPIILYRRSLSIKQLLILVLVSILIHSLGLFWFARSQSLDKIKLQSLKNVDQKKAEPKPIEFTIIPQDTQEKSTKDAPEDERISDSSAPAPPVPSPQPAVKLAPPPKPTADPIESSVKKQAPVASSSDPAASPQPSQVTPKKDSVATSLPSSKQPVPESRKPTNQPVASAPSGTSANDLLGGNYAKTLASGGEVFFSPEALKYKSVLNPKQLKALKGIDLSQYTAEMEAKVKSNWHPSFRQDERTTVLTFNIEKNGQISGLKVAQSSGSEEVDRESLEALQKSDPFAPLPANFPLKSLEITFSFNIHIY